MDELSKMQKELKAKNNNILTMAEQYQLQILDAIDKNWDDDEDIQNLTIACAYIISACMRELQRDRAPEKPKPKPKSLYDKWLAGEQQMLAKTTESLLQTYKDLSNYIYENPGYNSEYADKIMQNIRKENAFLFKPIETPEFTHPDESEN